MYDSTTTVTVGLDVHARSIRLAAVRADELLEEIVRVSVTPLCVTCSCIPARSRSVSYTHLTLPTICSV